MKMESDPTYLLPYATVMPLTRDLIGTVQYYYKGFIILYFTYVIIFHGISCLT